MRRLLAAVRYTAKDYEYLICLDRTRFLVTTGDLIDTTVDARKATRYPASEVAMKVNYVPARDPRKRIQIIPR